MLKRFAVVPLVVWILAPLGAQEAYPHHNITFGVGAAHPTGEIQSFMKTAPAINIGYGYRFHRYFQADLGLNMFFGAGQIHNFVNTDLGAAQLKDREYMIPFGGRAILPLLGGRAMLAGGGGGEYLRYSESINQPNYYYSIQCPICTSRGGWGAYGLANGSYFLDHDRHFRVGLTAQFVRAHTNGDPFGNVPGIRTSDHWLNLFAELGFSF